MTSMFFEVRRWREPRTCAANVHSGHGDCKRATWAALGHKRRRPTAAMPQWARSVYPQQLTSEADLLFLCYSSPQTDAAHSSSGLCRVEDFMAHSRKTAVRLASSVPGYACRVNMARAIIRA